MYMYTYMHGLSYPHSYVGDIPWFFSPIHQPPFIGDILIMSTLNPHYIPHLSLYPHYIQVMYLNVYIHIYIYTYR